MIRPRFAILLILVLLTPIYSIGSEYIGQESRKIKSLSEQDIEDIKLGRGWGLARPAELNGLPGPLHLLELKDALILKDDQIKKIEELYASMNSSARIIGQRYIEEERHIEFLLSQPETNEEELSIAVLSAAKTLAKLRLTHLKAHLATPALLTKSQLEQYQVLRGYTEREQCTNIPSGHDPDMWRLHNNCD